MLQNMLNTAKLLTEIYYLHIQIKFSSEFGAILQYQVQTFLDSRHTVSFFYVMSSQVESKPVQIGNRNRLEIKTHH